MGRPFVPTVCPVPGCRYVAPDLSSQRKHENVHSGQKPNVCTYDGCDARFKTKSSLNAHIRAVHLKIRKYKCHVCFYKCTNLCDMRRHLARHKDHDATDCQRCQALRPVGRNARSESVEGAVRRQNLAMDKFSSGMSKLAPHRRSSTPEIKVLDTMFQADDSGSSRSEQAAGTSAQSQSGSNVRKSARLQQKPRICFQQSSDESSDEVSDASGDQTSDEEADGKQRSECQALVAKESASPDSAVVEQLVDKVLQFCYDHADLILSCLKSAPRTG